MQVSCTPLWYAADQNTAAKSAMNAECAKKDYSAKNVCVDTNLFAEYSKIMPKNLSDTNKKNVCESALNLDSCGNSICNKAIDPNASFTIECKYITDMFKDKTSLLKDMCILFNTQKNLQPDIINFIYSNIPPVYKPFITTDSLQKLLSDCVCKNQTSTTCSGTLAAYLDTVEIVKTEISKIGLAISDICTLINSGVFDQAKLIKFLKTKMPDEKYTNENLSAILSCVCKSVNSTTLCSAIEKMVKTLITNCKINNDEFIAVLKVITGSPDTLKGVLAQFPSKYECIIAVINVAKLIELIKKCYPDMKTAKEADVATIAKVTASLNRCMSQNSTVETYKKYKSKSGKSKSGKSKSGKSKSGKSKSGKSLYIVIGVILLLLIVGGCIMLKRRK